MFKRHPQSPVQKVSKTNASRKTERGEPGGKLGRMAYPGPGGPPRDDAITRSGGLPGGGQLSPSQAPRPCERGALRGQAQLPVLETTPVAPCYRGLKPRSHACSSLFLDCGLNPIEKVIRTEILETLPWRLGHRLGAAAAFDRVCKMTIGNLQLAWESRTVARRPCQFARWCVQWCRQWRHCPFDLFDVLDQLCLFGLVSGGIQCFPNH